ncbi:MAG: GTPase Era [Micavibrio aeruginosavorus]|uniref:GTPase Era n=1 Tax=Micavibrio aeruginosavorus TaxID=349221 RepID=A0A2W5N0F3_9BACT|nr:MAG: GTPase Era [Micavibrio aeruginosavorus]
MNDQKTSCGFAAIIGAPNAGKSTLLNTMVGEKVSIVSSKVQTTRTRVLGIVIEGSSQIIFVDTPGLFKPGNDRMEKAIVAAAWQGLGDSDLVLFVVDSVKGFSRPVRTIVERLKDVTGKKYILVLNKVDDIARPKLLELATQMNQMMSFEATFMISARENDGVKDLVKYVAKCMPEGPFHYPEDQMTDMSMRLLSAEITREKLFRSVHEEIPYDITVETESWEEFDDGSIKIDQTIFVAREGQKKIILGKGGEMIGKIGTQARVEIEGIMGCRAHLKLFVKVRENWSEDSEHYKLWGLSANPDSETDKF